MMHSRPLVPVSQLCLVLAVAAPALGAQVADYRVQFSDADRRLVRVEARLATRDTTLLFYPDNYDAAHLADGWATYVRELRASDSSGADIPLRRSGRGQWALPPSVPRPVTLRYEILVHHDQGSWPVGWDEAAYAKRECDCVFMTGMALFIGARDLRSIRVSFDLPGPRRAGDAPWTSVTPWEPAGPAHAYRADSFRELSEVALVVGRMPTAELNVGGARVTIAAGRGLPDALPLFRESMAAYLAWAARAFGAPAVGRFAVVANPDVFTGGGAFVRSASLLFKEQPSAANRRDWGGVLAHEVLHLWNGLGMELGLEEEWFKEGVTDYLARKAMLAAGHMTRDEFVGRLAEAYGWYVPAAGARSLRAAGLAKRDNYPLVYNGGAIMGFVLDVELRRLTEGARGIEDLLSALYRESAATGRRVTGTMIAREASRLAGTSLAPLFERYVSGRERIPLEQYATTVGIAVTVGHPDANGKMEVTARIWEASASPALRLRDALFAGSPPPNVR